MTDPLSSATLVLSNLHLDLNLNMNLNPETMEHDDMYHITYRQPHNLYEPILFELLKQIRVGCAMF